MQTRRLAKLQFHIENHEQAILLLHLPERVAAQSEHVGSGAFAVLQIVGVVYDAQGIRIFEIYLRAQPVLHHRARNLRGCPHRGKALVQPRNRLVDFGMRYPKGGHEPQNGGSSGVNEQTALEGRVSDIGGQC